MKTRRRAPRERAEAAAPPPADPRVSVVVTCYNYGHFLGCCLDSVLSQSTAAAQIIVVNDGSTDDTARVLAGYGARVTAIETENRGQAAAFNTGFAASTGDIVIFLDADDALHPHALETILHHWRPDLAALTFGLETIDAAGRGTGLHRASVAADSGDNRPRLLGTGTFAFPPTSGNAFAHRLLDAVLPMPEADWRISADCYLIRAAALFGRFGHVPELLGAYRLHGANNYATGSDLTDAAGRAGNHRDNARALRALAKRAEIFVETAAEAAALRAALRLRAGVLLGEAAGRHSRKARGKAPAAMARLGLPRWPLHLPEGRWIDLTRPGPLRDILVPGTGAWPTAPPGACTLVFTIDPAAEVRPLHLRLAGADAPGPLTVTVDDVTAWCGPGGQPVEITIPLRPSPWQARRELRIDVIQPGAGPPGPQVIALHLGAAGTDLPAPCLIPDRIEPPAAALGAGLDPAEWALDTDGAATPRGREARLRVTTLPGAGELVLDFGAPPPRGRLTVRTEGAAIFTGALGDARKLRLRLPATAEPAARTLALTFADLAPDAPLPRIAGIGLGSRTTTGPPPLNLGETVPLWDGGAGFLGTGWQRSEAGVATHAAEAMIAFAPATAATDLRLHLELEPVLAPGPRLRHLVAVSLIGRACVTAELIGPGLLEVPLPDQTAGAAVRLGLHSIYVPEPATMAGPDGFAALILRSLTLHGRDPGPPPPPPRALQRPVPHLHALIDAARRLLDEAEDEDEDEDGAGQGARTLCSAITAQLLAADPAACLPLVADADTLVRLGEAARHVPPQGTPARIATKIAAKIAGDLAAPDPRLRLRAALLALLIPACRSPLAPDLEQLPPMLLGATGAMARYFGRPPEIETAAMHRAYLAYLRALLTSIDRILATAPEGSAAARLAAATLARLRSTPAIFGPGALRDLVRLRSRAIERLLARRGARLGLPRLPGTPTGRLRLGVLVRDVLPTPEGWALLGMYAGLDRRRFEPVLLRMDRAPDALDTGGRFAAELCLAGLPVDAAVAAIRELDLDLMITGAYVADLEKTCEVLAHRLAPLQIWAGAVCPTTGGLRSFDVALTCRATEPPDPHRHYTEPLAWIDGPLQAAYAWPAPRLPAAAAVRRELGLPPRATLLTSGALAHKIHDELLAAWAGILAAAPKAVLVLYPFAANWSLTHAPARLRHRLDRALAAAGVAPERATLLSTQTPERVRAILGAADLYLDSFPYTGATTVCEALACGTPALTCAGDALRQLTGASWVRAFDLPELVAGDPAAYVATACRLLADRPALPRLRRRLADRRAAGPPPHCDIAGFGRAFSDALWDLARGSGRFGDLAQTAAPADRPDGPAESLPRAPTRPRATRRGMPPVQLAILGSPRTGSTLLCRILNATPGVICHYELFHAAMIQYMDRTDEDPDAIRARDADPVGFLRRTMDAAAAERPSLFGFKHFAHDSEILTRHVVADPGWNIIHLERRNALAQFSSELIARAEGRWFGLPDAGDRTRVAFDSAAFEKWQAYYRDVERRRCDLYASFGRTVLFLEYDTLLAPETLGRLSGFLGVPIAPPRPSSLPLRQNVPDILARFTNPDEVAAYLAGRGLSDWAGAARPPQPRRAARADGGAPAPDHGR